MSAILNVGYKIVRGIKTFVLGIGRPLEGPILGGTFALLVIGIVDYYWENAGGGILKQVKLVDIFIIITLITLTISGIFAYSLTFLDPPFNDPEHLNYRLVWNSVFVINLLLEASFLELRDKIKFSTEMTLVTLSFIVFFVVLSFFRPTFKSSKEIAESLRILREKATKNKTLLEAQIALRDGLRELLKELTMMFRLYRITHFILLAPLFGVFAMIAYSGATAIKNVFKNVQVEFQYYVIVLWVVIVLLFTALSYIGMVKRDYLHSRGVFEMGLLEAELDHLLTEDE